MRTLVGTAADHATEANRAHSGTDSQPGITVGGDGCARHGGSGEPADASGADLRPDAEPAAAEGGLCAVSPTSGASYGQVTAFGSSGTMGADVSNT